jgi:hypothetical protein
MIENEITKLQILSTLKLLISAYLLFFWIPGKIFPQDYIDNQLDRIMFNIIHMAAIITLVFPLFIYIKVFGIVFVIIFFIFIKILFIKYFYRKNVIQHFREIYLNVITSSLQFLENPGYFFKLTSEKIFCSTQNYFSKLTFLQIFYWGLPSILLFYSIYLRVYRGYITLVGAAPDMYQFYYWGNILKLNVLFDKTAGAPYMWGGPVLVHTVNLFSNLNTVVIYNIFPVLFLSFMFFSICYVLYKLFNINGIRISSLSIAIILFGILLPSPSGGSFFGFVVTTSQPEIIKLLGFSLYIPNLNESLNRIITTFPAIFFWRFTTTLPYEIASSFFLINLFFLIKYIETKRNIHLLLYAETLAIIFSIHGGVAIPLFFCSLLIFTYSLISGKFSVKSLMKFTATVLIASIIGNLWLMQLLFMKFYIGIGAASPLLEKLIQHGESIKSLEPRGPLSIISIPSALLILIGLSFCFPLICLFNDKIRFKIISISLISIGSLFIYLAPNLGLPKIVDQSRMMVFVGYSYSIIFATVYHVFFDRFLFRTFLKKFWLHASLIILTILSLIVIILTPRWIDTKLFWENVHDIEYKEFPYLVYKIEDSFPTFSYTIVSYVQEFPQVISKGYHINTQDFLQIYNPVDKKLNIPTEYVFIFIEKTPKEFGGTGEYWYRWRRDIMLKLNDWIAIYSQNHDNIKLWYSSQWVDAYIIDNRTYESKLLKQHKELKETER